MKTIVRTQLIKHIDETIVIHSLEEKHIKEIIQLMVEQLQKRLEEQEISFTLTDRAIEKITKEGMDLEYGARPLRRSIQKNVEDFLSEELLKGNIKIGQKIEIDLNENDEFFIANISEFETV